MILGTIMANIGMVILGIAAATCIVYAVVLMHLPRDK